MKWTHIHASWWQAATGEAVHEIEILDDDDHPLSLFYGYASGAIRHCLEAMSLGEAQRQLESMEVAA